jgi:hypothetical protein
MDLAMILLGVVIGTAYFFTAGTESIITNFRYLELALGALALIMVYSAKHRLISEFKIAGKWTNGNIIKHLRTGPLTLRQRALLLTLLTSILSTGLLVGVLVGMIFANYITRAR